MSSEQSVEELQHQAFTSLNNLREHISRGVPNFADRLLPGRIIEVYEQILRKTRGDSQFPFEILAMMAERHIYGTKIDQTVALPVQIRQFREQIRSSQPHYFDRIIPNEIADNLEGLVEDRQTLPKAMVNILSIWLPRGGYAEHLDGTEAILDAYFQRVRRFDVSPEEKTAAYDLLEHLEGSNDPTDKEYLSHLMAYHSDRSKKFDSGEDAWKIIEYDLTLPNSVEISNKG